MAQVTTYNTLVAYIPEYFENDETFFTSQLDTFIGLCEAGFNRLIRSRRGETTTTLTTDADGVATLPTGYLEWRGAYIDNASAIPLTMISAPSQASYFPIQPGGEPYYVSISGNTLTVGAAAARDVVLTYYGKFTGLSASNATNWVIDQHPDLYVEGVSAEAAAFLKDYDAEGRHRSKAKMIQDEIISLRGTELFYNAGISLSGSTP
jgi:hypothetical protein